MTEIASRGEVQSAAPRCAGRHALLLGFIIFGLLWSFQLPIRENYIPNEDDIFTLADGLLLAPGADWLHWFIRGYSRLFDLYPDAPVHGGEATAWNFFRPAYQFLIYLAHFVLGRDWASYLLINCLAVAAVGALAFLIAQAVLELRTGPSLIAAILVVLSPPIWESWQISLAFAINPLATAFAAGSFLAVFVRRDLLGVALLFLALLTKENTVWAPLAAAITIMLRPKLNEPLRHRALIAAAMLLPIAMWLSVRFAFFGGIGGTYATAGYASLAESLNLILHKLTHLHYVFMPHKFRFGGLPDRGMAVLVLDRATAVLIYAFVSLWSLRIVTAVVSYFRSTMREMRLRTVEPVLLVALWAAMALAFYVALPLPGDRYATSVVTFAWPALVFEVERRDKPLIWLGLALCLTVSMTRNLAAWSAEPPRNDSYRSMDAVLRQTPTGTREIYVLSAGGLQETNPEYVRLVLGLSAEIVRLIEIDWNCRAASDSARFDHSRADGVVSLTVNLPTCASFHFYTDRFNSDIANGRLHRNEKITYELTEAVAPYAKLGRKMTVHIKLSGPARFVIEHGAPNGIAWFDIVDAGHRVTIPHL